MRKFLLKISVAGMVILAASVANAKTPLETPTTEAEFEKIVGELKTEARTFADADDDKGPSQSQSVENLQYSPESSAPLGEAIKSLPQNPLERMYILSQLLTPLKMAPDDAIRTLAPALTDILSNDCRYKSMPALSGTTPALLAPSDKDTPERKRSRDEAHRKKATDERAVVKYNRTVNALEKTIKHLLVLINDQAADETLLQRLTYENDRQQATFEDTLAVIKSEAGKMKQDRAKKFYDNLKYLASRGKHPKQYSDPTKPIYKADANSSFESREIHFAVSTIKVVNVLATAAQEPAVKAPGEKPPEKRRQIRTRR